MSCTTWSAANPEAKRSFVSFTKLEIKGSVISGLSKAHWDLRNAELRDPFVRVVQIGDRFNFSDLMELGGDEAEQVPSEESPKVFFSVEGLT